MANRIVFIVTLLISTLLLCAAGFYNGYPLLYPDSIEYIDVGKSIYEFITNGTPGWFGQRSPFYSLLTYLLHQGFSLWLVVFVQSFLVSYVVWACFHIIFPKLSSLYFLIIIVSLSVLSSVSWFTSIIMADVFAAVLILGVFNLGFDNRSGNISQRAIMAAIVVLAITVHTSHLLMVPVLLIGFLGTHWYMQTPIRVWTTAVLWLLAAISVAVFLMLYSTCYLYKEVGLVGPHPPFLLARVIGDGPGRLYLKEQCVNHDYAVCKYVDLLTDDSNHFLWNPKGVMKQASKRDVQRIKKEEMRVVLGTIQNYTSMQISASMKNFIRQFKMVWIQNSDAPFIDNNIIKVFPASGEKHFSSRQHLKTLPLTALKVLQCMILGAAAIIIFYIGAELRKRLPKELFALTILIVIGLFSNSLITGIVSIPEPRFQARIIWLVPMLAFFYIFAMKNMRNCSVGKE